MKPSHGVLVVGAGWVSAQHLAAYVKNPFTTVAAICDKQLEQARKQAAMAGLSQVALYDNLDDALRNPDVDIVFAAIESRKTGLPVRLPLLEAEMANETME